MQEGSRQVREKVTERFIAGLGQKNNMPSFKHFVEHCSSHHLKMYRKKHIPCVKNKSDKFLMQVRVDRNTKSQLKQQYVTFTKQFLHIC